MIAVAILLSIASAEAPSPCSTPRQAAATILGNMRDDRLDLHKAARCADAKDLSVAERERAMDLLKEALDASGARVKLDEISDDAGYVDPRTYESAVTIAREVPALRLEKIDGQWLIPTHVLRRAEEIYRDAVAIDLTRLRKYMPAWSENKVLGLYIWQVTALLLAMLIGVALHLLVTRVISWKAHRVLTAFKIDGADGIRRAAAPLGVLMFIGVVAAATPSLGLPAALVFVMMLGMRIIAAVTALVFFYRAVDVVTAEMVRRAAGTPTKMDDHIAPLVRRIMKVLVILIGAVIVLQAFDVNVASLVAGLGIGGLAVALAAKDTIGNFFGSVAIFLDRPFQVGDWVIAGDLQGTVENVGFRSTQVRTIKDTIVSVPNAKLADEKIETFGARRYRHVRVDIGLTYDTDPDQMEAFCDGVRAIIDAHTKTRKENVEVHFTGFGDSSLNFMVHFYSLATSWSEELRVRHEVLMDIHRLVRDIGAEIAFPTRTLHVTQEEKREQASPDVDALRKTIRAYGPGGARVKAPGPRILPAPPSEPAPPPEQHNAPPRTP